MDQKIPQSVIDKARSDVVSVIGKYVELTKSGTEYEACCPFHQERTPSFKVSPNKNYYYCFGCGVSGDAIDFIQQYQNVGFHEAIKVITGEIASNGNAPVRAPAIPKKADEWQPITPVPEDAPAPPSEFSKQIDGAWRALPASSRWAYLDANGDLLGYTARIDHPGGGKDVIPQSYCMSTKTGELSWRWLSFAKPRPIYGMEKLSAHPNAQVMVVEGEKTADAGQQLFIAAGIPMDAVITVAWPGGAKAIKYIDWSPLSGRKVGLWPDADLHDYGTNHPKVGQRMPFIEQPGTAAMLDIYDAIIDSAAVVKFIVPPAGPEYKCGWDLADADTEWPLLAHLKANSILAEEVRERFAVEEPEPDPDPDPRPPADDTPPWEEAPEGPEATDEPSTSAPVPRADEILDEFDDELVSNGYFSILGHDHNEYYFFHHEKGQVLSRTSSNFSDTGLIELAPLQWWEAVFPAHNGGINKKMAVNWIFRTANARGIYDPTRVRGRGAWLDRGRRVYHHGNYLTVDGDVCKVTDIDSSYVYPMAHSMPEPSVPMSDEEGLHLTKLAEMVRFTMPASAALMAGWVMLAPICGALGWRPHIWLTGAPGSGKSTVQSKFCAALVRGIGIYAQGDSTEAGIRQKLQSDARPVLIDEAESNNERDKQRIENVIGLIRKTSTESQAETLKGTAVGASQAFQIRSMFCLASINTNLPTKADIDRLSRLVIKSPDKRDPAASAEHWAKLEAGLNAINEDTEIASRLLARALSLMPVIMENLKVFRRVAAVKFGTQRDGDQFGTLMAGCWCLSSSSVATDAEAAAMLERYDFQEHTEDHDLDDSGRALEALLGAKLRVGSSGEYSVFELIRETSAEHRLNVVESSVADATLKRHGIRVEHALGQLWFGTSVSNLGSLVKNLPFVTALSAQLLRIEGAEKIQPKKYNGTTSRGVSVPLAPILDDEGEAGSKAEEYPF